MLLVIVEFADIILSEAIDTPFNIVFLQPIHTYKDRHFNSCFEGEIVEIEINFFGLNVVTRHHNYLLKTSGF